jgi:glycosyltransferase involved in cell wall biosynthesis
MGDMQAVPLRLARPTPANAALAHPTEIGAVRPGVAPSSLKILHVLRSPLGGLFRHVLDLAKGQAERGHRVGLIVDSLTGGPRAGAILADLAPRLALGVERVAIARHLDPRDIGALQRVAARIKLLAPDVIHGHGAKGAALARLSPNPSHAIRVYTPHGGTLVYSPGTLDGSFYRSLERLLNWRTDLFLFESRYAADLFRTAIGRPRAMVRVVRNGISDSEFAPVATGPNATDIVCVGELRSVKGIDVLIEALASLKRSGIRVSATFAGDGPDGEKLKAQSQSLGIADQVRFIGHCPARNAFAMGRILVVPSRAESLPYVVLEAAAAGMPVIATAVGGIPEIFGSFAPHLVPSGNVAALAGAIATVLRDPSQARFIAREINTRVRNDFSLQTMVEGGLEAYREAIAIRKLAQFT